jgi:protein-tyrosine phosphatase
MKPSILFVCLGNICRSPLAEAAMKAEAARLGLDVEIESAGTGDWHVGHAPDARAQATALKHRIDISGYRGRQVKADDFRQFTHIVALDVNNLADLKRLAPKDGTAKLSLLLDHAGRGGQSVADPYYGDDAGFETTWADVSAGAAGLAKTLAS